MRKITCKVLVFTIVISSLSVYAENKKINILKNSSFEAASVTPQEAINWKGLGRASAQAKEGKFSYLIEGKGDSDKYIAVSQKLDLDKVKDASSLNVSTFIYVENYESGSICPIYFIIQFNKAPTCYFRIKFNTETMPFNFWYKIKGKMNLKKLREKNGEIKNITFMVLGTKWKDKPFKGKFYIDDIQIHAEK